MSHLSLLVGIVASATDRQALFAILRIARLLLEAAEPAAAGEALPDWVRKLIVAQACVCERLGVIGDERLLSRGVRILETVLKSKPHLMEVYLDVLTDEERSGESLVALSAVTAFALALPQYEGGRYFVVCSLSPTPTKYVNSCYYYLPRNPDDTSSSVQRRTILVRVNLIARRG